MLGDEAAGGADAVEHGHVQVEQDRVGLVLGHQRQGLLAVGGGADHVDAGQPAEQQDQALADAGLVVGDDDAQRTVGGHRAAGRRAAGHRAAAPGGAGGDPAFMSTDASGSSAVTAHSASRGPASRVPFSSRRRSRMPVSP